MSEIERMGSQIPRPDNELLYHFSIPIGDWSSDGHSLCDWYYYRSNKTLIQIREAYFQSMDKFPDLNPGSICSQYEEGDVEIEIYDELLNQFPALGKEEVDRENDKVAISPDFMAEFVIQFIQHSLPEWEIEIMKQAPMIPFFGYDDKKRHIDNWGYGLFLSQ
jgi:hypothetical protein